MRNLKILAIDDEKSSLDQLVRWFKNTDHELLITETGEEGIKKAINELPDIILLDWFFPEQKLGGKEILQELAKNPRTEYIPIIILSHKPEDEDLQLEAFDFGNVEHAIPKNYDYISWKSLKVLEKRIENSLKRRERIIGEGYLRFDESSQTIIVGDKRIERVNLQVEEFYLCLLLRKGKLVSYKEIWNCLWANDPEDEPTVHRRNSINQLANILRNLIEVDAQHPQHLITRPKQGYQLVD